MSKQAIEGTVTVSALVGIDETLDLLAVDKVVPSAKAQILHSIKKQMYDKADKLTVEDINWRSHYMPKLPETLSNDVSPRSKETPDVQ